MRASREAARILALVAAIVILAITAWVCLIWATVVLLSRWLGAGLALVSVGGALVFLLAVILVVVSAMRGRKPVPAGFAQRVLPSALLAAKGITAHPLAIRAALLLIGVVFALSAAVMPEQSPKDRDPPS